MDIRAIYTAQEITEKAGIIYEEERSRKRLDGWFLVKEIECESREEYRGVSEEQRSAMILRKVVSTLPLSISGHAVFAGTQRDSFTRTDALVNPVFELEPFHGYCDQTAVYQDMQPNKIFTADRIQKVRDYIEQTNFVRNLTKTYDLAEKYTSEIVFFIEQVTGHIVPDFRPVLKYGVSNIINILDLKIAATKRRKQKDNYKAMRITLEGVIILANRYADMAAKQQKTASPTRTAQLGLLENTLRKVPEYGADTLYEAIQSFLLLWQVMCLEQVPNPCAFSVGNADRIFEPYRAREYLNREMSAALFKHFLAFLNIGGRSWAMSQNVLVGGRDLAGNDLTNEMTYAIMDAYYDMNFPQPMLSVKLHKNTPDCIYESIGKFLFTPGCLTPSFFNDDAVFETMKKSGIEISDLPDYAVAGCQEPLIMGKDNGNTTNSWLNLAKILELTINNGASLISQKQIGPKINKDISEILRNIRFLFYQNVEFYLDKMADAANNASIAISYEPVPFLSIFMGGIDSGIDLRDTKEQGSKYNASGCLIHGLSVVANSFTAIDRLLKYRAQDCGRLLRALQTDYVEAEELRRFLQEAPKFGNNINVVDEEARVIASRVSDMVTRKKNYLGNPFRADWSTPSTHLLYGYWTGATPDGRKAREMLSYGVDPLYGEAEQGLEFRILSSFHLPYDKFNGGYASHYGIDPRFFHAESMEGKGLEFKNKVLKPTFFNEVNPNVSPFYLCINVTTPEILRKVMNNPKKYAPNGVYLMQIHGTSVNFLELSPTIQLDIIKRLDLQSTAI